MTGIVVDEISKEGFLNELDQNATLNENAAPNMTPTCASSPHNIMSTGPEQSVEGVNALLEQLLREVEVFDQSTSRHTSYTDGGVSMIDSELRHLMDGINEEGFVNRLDQNSTPFKENTTPNLSSLYASDPQGATSTGPQQTVDGIINSLIEQLNENMDEMESFDQSTSKPNFGSDGEEPRIDSESCQLVGGNMRKIKIVKEDINAKREKDSRESSSSSRTEKGSGKSISSIPSKKGSPVQLGSEASSKSSSKGKSLAKPPIRKNIVKQLKRNSVRVTSKKKPGTPFLGDSKSKMVTGGLSQLDSAGVTSKKKSGISPSADSKSKIVNGGLSQLDAKGVNSKKKLGTLRSGDSKLKVATEGLSGLGLDNPHLGPYLLKQARDLMSSRDSNQKNIRKALELSLRAAKSFEICANGKPNLEIVMCLHVVASIYCSLGQYNKAIPVLKRSIEIPTVQKGQEHGLAKFASFMQLGDTYAILGQLDSAIMCYTSGLEVQKQVIGENDPRVGETCRYLAEAYVQALQFDEAIRVCEVALAIHKKNSSTVSLEEAADRRLMALICETKGDHETALEHLMLASMSMVASGQEAELASVNCSIGDNYLSLSRYDEALLAYHKALMMFKTTKGENHPAIGSILVRLAELYNTKGKLRESKSYCENALQIYDNAMPGIPQEEIANGLTQVSAVYESMNELEEALKLLQKALRIHNNAPGQQNIIAGIEAQMGVIHYILGNYSSSYDSFKNSIPKLRANGDKKTAFFAVVLNQMGLVCVQLNNFKEATEFFEEARSVLEQEYGPYHRDTLGVYSNLAGTYDAVGRKNDAIDILEHVVVMREETLGTANPDVDDEKRRLSEMLKDAGRTRSRKAKTLENLLDANNNAVKNVMCHLL